MIKYDFIRLYFDDPEPEPEPTGREAEENTNVSTDFEPAISIDHVNRISRNINTLRKALGITRLIPMQAGTLVKRYKYTVTKGEKQAAEGEIIPLSKVERKALTPIELVIDPKRRLTTMQAIQKVGRDIALNEADDELVAEVQKDVNDAFFEMITANTATAADGGATLQAAVASAWAKMQIYFEDKDATPIYFLNPSDVAVYLASAQITTQTAFGFKYVEDFMGLGSAFLTGKIPQGDVYCTATENLNGVYVPQGGDVADAFDLTFDETGIVGMTHSRLDERGAIQSLLVSGIIFYPEDASGVIKAHIGE